MVPGTPESAYNTHISATGRNFIGNMFLGIPYLRAMFTDWQGDLAESASYAFSQGVAGIMSNVYRVPFNSIDKNDSEGKIDFQFPFDHKEETSSEEKDSPDAEEESKSEPTMAANNDSEEEFCPYVDAMLDRPLRNLYKSAHESGRDQIQIRLQMEPKRALVYEMFSMPFFNKAAVETDPSVFERMKKIMATMPNDFGTGFQLLYSYLLEQVEIKDQFETTVEIQVLVDCDEVFQVHCKETGALLQGTPDGKARSVLHLVRMETTATTVFGETFPYLPSTTIGNWIITDIDDLLGPKKWYHKSSV